MKNIVIGYITLGFGNYIAYIDDDYWMITDRDFKDIKLFDRKRILN